MLRTTHNLNKDTKIISQKGKEKGTKKPILLGIGFVLLKLRVSTE